MNSCIRIHGACRRILTRSTSKLFLLSSAVRPRATIAPTTCRQRTLVTTTIIVPPLTDETREIAHKLLLQANNGDSPTPPLQRRFALSRAITLLESTNAQQQHDAQGLLAYLLQQQQQLGDPRDRVEGYAEQGKSLFDQKSLHNIT